MIEPWLALKAIHPRAFEISHEMKWGRFDLGMLVEVDHRIRTCSFGREEVVHLHEAYERSEHHSLYRDDSLYNTLPRETRAWLIETLYLRLQSTGWVAPSKNILRGFIKEDRSLAIEALILRGPNVLNCGALGFTLLRECALLNQVRLLDLLLEGGAHVDEFLRSIESGRGVSISTTTPLVPPIALAVCNGHTEIFHKLVKAGTNIHWRDDIGNNLIRYGVVEYLHPNAVKSRKEAIFGLVCELARMGVDPNECYLGFGHSGVNDLMEKRMHAEAQLLQLCFTEHAARQIEQATPAIRCMAARGRL